VLLDQSGVTAEVLALALNSIAVAAEATAPPPPKEKSIFKSKELVYPEDEYSYIYQRGDTKRKIYYLRVWDANSGKPFIKSLKTTDRVQAVTTAREIYQRIKGKIATGQRLKQINTAQLIEQYLKLEKAKITVVPREGITPDRYRLKCTFLGYWQKYIDELGLKETPIDKIPPYKTRSFGIWLKQLPKPTGSDISPRSNNYINNAISEILKVYKDVAIRERFLKRDEVPEIDRLKEQKNSEHKRDILSLEQYEKLWKYMEYKYCKDKSVSAKEKALRVIFTKAIGILSNVGCRPKELLGVRVNELYTNPSDTPDYQKTHLLFKVRADNSKTGISRVVSAPIKRRVEVIKQKYKELGVEQEPTDFLLINPSSPDKKPYTREQLGNRFRKVLELSGLKEELEQEGKKINLYSFRHQWFTWRLRYGNVPLPLLAKAGGNSCQQIMAVYAHIEVEKQTSILTRAQTYAKGAEIDLDVRLYNE